MSNSPLILIPTGEIKNALQPWASTVYGQSYTYSEAIEHAGGLPLLLPIIESENTLRELYVLADGILFAGGNDVNPKLYDQEPYDQTNDFSVKRDTQEYKLIEWALTDDKPILAICRGMQLLNVFCGGSLYQDIPTDLPSAQNHAASREHQDTTFIAHYLTLLQSSNLAHIVGPDLLPANSQHHQSVSVIGDGLIQTAWAEDNVIEAIELPQKRFVVGVQPHPEGLEAGVEPRWRKLFEAFVAAANVQS